MCPDGNGTDVLSETGQPWASRATPARASSVFSMPTGLSLAVPWSSAIPRRPRYLLVPTWTPMGLAVAEQARGAAGQGSRTSPPRSAAASGAWIERGLGGQQLGNWGLSHGVPEGAGLRSRVSWTHAVFCPSPTSLSSALAWMSLHGNPAAW